MAVLYAIGFTRGQLAAVVPRQSLPLALAGIVVGIPVGIGEGRRQYVGFARRLGVIEGPSTPALMVVGLMIAVLIALALSIAAAVVIARRARPAAMLRG